MAALGKLFFGRATTRNIDGERVRGFDERLHEEERLPLRTHLAKTIATCGEPEIARLALKLVDEGLTEEELDDLYEKIDDRGEALARGGTSQHAYHEGAIREVLRELDARRGSD